MTAAADRIRANAERLKKASPAPGPHEPTPAPPAPTTIAVRQKNVRRTVDLSPTAHRALDTWQRGAADRLGLARVTGQDVIAALVDQLLADADLSEQIIRTIAAQRT
ncbi:hypothetical protein [Mycobacteroides abscessus]|uniref:hypothetical protein n=1 Tax=Mycobacteroides abscessus TaxID=36809 RepID=UPI0009A8A463|nr:hypothetical protein [Mycobacteroides abscessus]TXH17417.1 MAG: hypothetical protein E6R06_28870 [Mycobacterium sp.]SLH35508.1 potassium-transporting ATPase subunit C [Mycobacteroides abscessus subsp. massiliense]